MTATTQLKRTGRPTRQAVAAAVKEMTVFCLERQGRCFKGWTANKIFQFIAWHYLSGSIFVISRERTQKTDPKKPKIKAVGIAWPADAYDIRRRDEKGIPQFDWRPFDPNGNALLISTVFGERRYCGELLQAALQKWPQVKELFTYRRGKLAELPLTLMKRFTQEVVCG